MDDSYERAEKAVERIINYLVGIPGVSYDWDHFEPEARALFKKEWIEIIREEIRR